MADYPGYGGIFGASGSYEYANGDVPVWDATLRRFKKGSGGGGGGTVTTTGSPASGNLTKFSGATSITNGDLSGDVTTSGTLVATAKAALKAGTIGITIDGGGSVITTGWKGAMEVPYAGTITAARIVSTDAESPLSGSIVVDIKKASYSGLFSFTSIVSATPPTLSSATKAEDTTLSGWTTAISAGDWLGFSVTSATTLTRVQLQLTVTK